MTNLFNLTGRVAIITGASSGIGAEVGKAYALQGANVALFARRIEKLDSVATQIKALGGNVITIKCDVTKEEDVKNGVAEVIKKYGKVDILLNNAGIALAGSVDELDEDTWDQVMDINVKGAYLMSKYVVKNMKENKYGRIINIASVNGLIGGKYDARHAYNASKAGVIGLTVGMATSLAQYGITVNAIGPGLFKSEMTENTLFAVEGYVGKYNLLNPTGRPGNIDEINGAAIYFASETSAYTTAQTLFIDGGYTAI